MSINCPECGGDTHAIWVANRMLRDRCENCFWKGEPRVPETIAIKTGKWVSCSKFSGHTFVLYDRYGHVLGFSRNYNTEGEARAALTKEMSLSNKVAGPCTAVLWPDKIWVEGTVFTDNT